MVDTLFSWMFFTVGPAIIDIAVAIGILKWVFDKTMAILLSTVMLTYGMLSFVYGVLCVISEWFFCSGF